MKIQKWSPYHWDNRDLWPDLVRGWLLCSWLGHRFEQLKMYDELCVRCRASRPIVLPRTWDVNQSWSGNWDGDIR